MRHHLRGPDGRPQPDILTDYEIFARRVRLRCHFGAGGNFERKFHIAKPNWMPPLAPPRIEQWLVSVKESLETRLANMPRTHRLNISPKQHRFLQQLRRDDTLIVKPADKNLGLTLLDKSWYDNEVMRQLGDSKTYKEVDSASMHIQIKRIYATLIRMFDTAHKDGILSDNVLTYIRNRIKPDSTIIPRFYCLPKIHKPTLSGRPIVPSHSWITTPASIWLDHILQPLVREFIYTLTPDSKSLIYTLELLQLPLDCIFVTADIVSLYTNINLNHGLACVRLFLHEHEDRVPPMHARQIISILDFVLRNNYIDYEGRCFLQLVGTAMGTPVAVIFANIFMFILERGVINRNKSKILLYRRLLDDILVILTPDHDDFIKEIQNMSRDIKLELISSEHSASFLDLKISKGRRFYHSDHPDIHIVDLEVHQKALNAYLYIPFSSFHRECAQGAFIITELQRYVRNCSSIQFFRTVRQHFFNRLRERGYPEKFLKPWFTRVHYSERMRLLFGRPSEETTPVTADSTDSSTVYFSTQYNSASAILPMQRILTESLPAGSGILPRMSYKRSTNLLGMLCSDKKSNVNNVTPAEVTSGDNPQPSREG